MDLDTATIRVLAAIEREQDEGVVEADTGINPVSSDGALCDPPADLAASGD